MYNFTKDSTSQDFVEELRDSITSLGYGKTIRVTLDENTWVQVKPTDNCWYLSIVLTSPKFLAFPMYDTREYLEVALSLRKLLDRWCEAKEIKS